MQSNVTSDWTLISVTCSENLPSCKVSQLLQSAVSWWMRWRRTPRPGQLQRGFPPGLQLCWWWLTWNPTLSLPLPGGEGLLRGAINFSSASAPTPIVREDACTSTAHQIYSHKKKTINTLLTLSVLRRYKNLKRKQPWQQTTECLAESFSQRQCTKSWWFWQMSKLNSLSPSDLLTCRWNWAQAELWAASSAPRWQVVVNEWWMGGSAYFCLSIYWMESKWTCHMTKSLCQFTVQIQFKPKNLHLHLLHLHLCLLSANRTSEQVSLLSDQSDLVGSVYHLWCFVSWLVDLCVCVFPHCCADWALVRRAELKLQFREGSVPEHLVWNHEPTPPPGFTGLVLTETFAHLPVNKPCFLPAFGSTCLVVSTET